VKGGFGDRSEIEQVIEFDYWFMRHSIFGGGTQ
jgi:hypothetical protein